MFVVSVRERGKEAHKFTFRKRQITVGRLRINDIILPKRNISKRHAKFEINPDNQIMVYDMGSTNGTFVNAVRATTGVLVSATDKVFVGDYILQLQLVEDKSAIDLRDPLPGASGYSMPDESEGDVKATIAGLDTRAIQEELRRLGYKSPSDDMGATATIMVDSLGPSPAPPPLGELDEDSPPSVGSDGSLMSVEVESEESIEVEMPVDEAPPLGDMSESGAEMVEDSVEMEEVLDIPLVEEEITAQPVARPVSPVAAPLPPPALVRAAYVPAGGITERPTITAQAPAQVGAPVSTMQPVPSKYLVADPPRAAVPVTAAAGGPPPYAAVWDTFENELVAELFVGSQGAVRVYGRNGENLNLGGPLQGASAVRALAEHLLPGKEPGGTVTVAGGMAYVLKPESGCCCVRLVKTPGLPSLANLQERRLMSLAQGALLKKLVEEGQSIVILGGGATADSVVHALSGLYTSARRVVLVGPGWPIAHGEARAIADYSLIGSGGLIHAVAGLRAEAVFGLHLPGHALPKLISMSAGTGVPFITSVSAPAGDAQAILEAMLRLDGDFRPTMLHSALSLCSVAVFTTTRLDGRVCLESAMRLVLDSESDRPMLVPLN